MYSPTVYLSLVVLLHISNVALAADVNGKVGERILIPCKITGTYVLPEWLKDALISIANEGGSSIHPAYSARFSYDSDQRTLIVDPVQLNDTGSYVCTHSGGTNSPQTTTVEIKEPEDDACSNPCPIVKAIRAFFVLAIVVITVVIIYCCYIWFWANKEYQKMKVIQEDNNATAVLVILIIAAVLFITISTWFIVMQATVEDCEEMTKKECNINIGLLVVEIVVFVLGVIDIILAYICHRRMKMKIIKIIRSKILQIITSTSPNHTSREHLERNLPDVEDIGQHLNKLEEDCLISCTKDGHFINTSKTETTPDYPTSDKGVKKPPSLGCERDTADVSPQHRPQPPLPPKERHGSDLSSVSRKNVKLDPIPPIRKNNSTTELHMDKPRSEQSNIKTSNRGLSTVIDQEFDQPQTNRLTPLDHTVMDESIKRKKKKKTKTNNDNVKFDNDND